MLLNTSNIQNACRTGTTNGFGVSAPLAARLGRPKTLSEILTDCKNYLLLGLVGRVFCLMSKPCMMMDAKQSVADDGTALWVKCPSSDRSFSGVSDATFVSQCLTAISFDEFQANDEENNVNYEGEDNEDVEIFLAHPAIDEKGVLHASMISARDALLQEYGLVIHEYDNNPNEDLEETITSLLETLHDLQMKIFQVEAAT